MVICFWCKEMERIKLFYIEGVCSESLSIHYQKQPPSAQNYFLMGSCQVCSLSTVKLFLRDSPISFPSSTLLALFELGSLTTGGACSPSVFFPRTSASCPAWGYRTASGVMVSLTTALLVLQNSCDSRFALVSSAHCSELNLTVAFYLKWMDG